MFIRRGVSEPEPGLRFTKMSDPETVWTVHRTLEPPLLPPHVELRSDGPPRRSIVIAQSVVRDQRLYRRLDD